MLNLYVVTCHKTGKKLAKIMLSDSQYDDYYDGCGLDTEAISIKDLEEIAGVNIHENKKLLVFL